MAKVARRPAAAPKTPLLPQVGDKVIPERSESTYVIIKVRSGGQYVDLELPGTNLDRFHVDVSTLKFVDRVSPKPTKSGPDTDELLDRIASVQTENLQRLDDDVAILMKYLKTQGAPKAVIDALEALNSEQHEGWNAAVNRIGDILKG
jgi:hypothetical protein